MKNGRFVISVYDWLIYEFEIDHFFFKTKVYVAVYPKSFPKFNTNLSKLIEELP